MELREYYQSDCQEISELFYQTVHCVNSKDYSKEQIDVWATGNVDIASWNRSFLEHKTIVAIENNKIVGFGDIDKTGYLDRLYIDKDYQALGIGSAICSVLESDFKGKKITVHSSITAKPFFLKRGYHVVKEQEVIRSGIALTNYVMEKYISKN